MLKVWLLISLCGLAVACDDEGDEPGSSAGSSSGSVGDYCAAQCERADECGELLGSVAQCETSCAKFSGKLKTDRPCLFTSACIEGHRTLSCDEVAEIGVPKACEESCR
jgi:hypothetical protein